MKQKYEKLIYIIFFIVIVCGIGYGYVYISMKADENRYRQEYTAQKFEYCIDNGLIWNSEEGKCSEREEQKDKCTLLEEFEYVEY